MPTSTTNYGLIKPGTDDPILIGQINDNMDTIDTVLKDHSDKIDAAALGIKFKGEVNYYADLPNNAEIGDAYTVKYAGSSGTTPDGTEYVWGTVSDTNQWINFSKDSYTKAEVDSLLALKQNALNSAQLAAVNSGINSAKVAQIETNKNNISTANAELIELVDNGAKNVINNTLTNGSTSNQVTATVDSNLKVTLSGTTPSNVDASFAISSNKSIPAGTYKGSGCPSGGAIDKYRIDYVINNSTVYRDTGNGVEFTVVDGDVIRSQIVVYHGNTAPSAPFAPMVCTKAAWNVSQKYVPYAPTNAELYKMIKALQPTQ